MFVEAFELADADLTRCAHALSDRRHLCWLDGAAHQGDTAGSSFLGCDPVETRREARDWPDLCATLNELATPSNAHTSDASRFARMPRWVGYVAYDATFARDDVRTQRHARADHPLLWFARYDAWLVLDHATQRCLLVGDDRDSTARLRAKLERKQATPELHAPAGVVRASDARRHSAAIDRALEQIARGDLYQVNLARSFAASLDGDALALWIAMRDRGDVPLGVYLDAGDHHVLCRSMETFLRWDRGTRTLQSHPIKGTIARPGDDDARDARALLNDDKERAEHTMIVDLMRNDLGRVAEVGSVRPSNVMRVEPFAGLSHLVSTVQCTTRSDVTLGDIFDATFPPGSVTGTPKLAAIAAIEHLEAEPRGIYCGAIGHIDQAGGCHFAVAIRTAVVRDGVATYFAGGGIVEGSETAREVAETELKARVFVDAAASLEADDSGGNRL